MDALIAFYNKQHGMKKEFIFVYDGIEEHCFFASPITISAIRELTKVVGYEAQVQLICTFQASPYQGQASISDKLNITPKDRVEHKIDWNTKTVSMIFTARQETYVEPTETFSVNLVGIKETRDRLVKMFNLHGSMPFTFPFDGKNYLVRFPDTLEITDKRSMTRILGFESSFDLEVVKAPNDGAYFKEPSQPTSTLVKEELSLRDWYRDGCMIKGVSYKNKLEAGLKKLQEFYIIDCTRAFRGSTEIYEVPELDTTRCQLFDGMFSQSKVRIVHGLDLSNAVSVVSMFEDSCVESINFPLNMPLCEHAQCMFRGATGIKSLPHITIGLDTAPRELFRAAYNLTDVRGLTIPNAQSLDYAFAGTAIESVPILDFPKLENARYMFGGCNALKSIWFRNSGELVHVMGMFLYCFALESITGLNMTSVTPVTYSRHSTLHSDLYYKDLYGDMFVNTSEDYNYMFSENPNSSDDEDNDASFSYKGLSPDMFVNVFGGSLKTMTMIDKITSIDSKYKDISLLNSYLLDKYYLSLSLAVVRVNEVDSNGEVVDEHYYFQSNSVETITIIDGDGSTLAKYKRTDRFDGYDWFEDYRREKYGEVVN